MLTDKVAIVTGASRGIGKAIVYKLVKRGAIVVINYRSKKEKAEAEEVVKNIIEKGGKAIIHQADVSNYIEAEGLINKAKETYGSVDILVNNAGITRDTLMLKMSEEDFDMVINVNLKGTFNCIKHVNKIMLKQRSGRIINIASVIGIVGNAGQANYAASKAGIIGLTKSMAKEIAKRGITVNAVAPGFIETDMTDNLSENTKKEILENIPLKKMGSGEDIANAVVFLASEDASYITGQVINVDGGMVC